MITASLVFDDNVIHIVEQITQYVLPGKSVSYYLSAAVKHRDKPIGFKTALPIISYLLICVIWEIHQVA